LRITVLCRKAGMAALFGDDPDLVHPSRGFKWSRDTRGYVFEFRLNKDLTITLITGHRQ